ncbi:MAG: flavodoxin domain-containing protein [Ferruginibacter sp.]
MNSLHGCATATAVNLILNRPTPSGGKQYSTILMLTEPALQTLLKLIAASSREELIWMNGYLSAHIAKTGSDVSLPVAEAAGVAAKKISLVFGTETGNAKRLATQLAAVAKKKGINTKLVGLDQYRFTDLSKEEYFFVVISTQGDGEPPATAKKFYEHIQQSLTLPKLKYSVLALGDSSYPLFCKTGEEVDQRLGFMGGERIVPLQKCDVDYEEDAMEWFEKVVNALATGNTALPDSTQPVTATKKAGKKYYEGTILTNVNLNDRGSSKETYHIEIAAEEEIGYEPGDAIGIVPTNRLEVVHKILSLVDLPGDTPATAGNHTATVEELLVQHVNICYLPLSIVQQYAAIIGQQIPDVRMDLADLLRIYPLGSQEQFLSLLQALTPITPRLYSVASAKEAHGESEVHIIVSKNAFNAEEEQRYGLCSEFLGNQPVDSRIRFYVHRNKNFRLPAEDKDIILIGPGTGIAPFRSFLAKRQATGDTGRNWLFFGEQHFVSDFLYQTEIQDFANTGLLTHLDLAFSRDQPEKIYVQHRMQQKGEKLWQWLQSGACLYLCGAKEPMAADVEKTLLEIFRLHGGLSETEATAYLETLSDAGQYCKDVY